MLPNDFYNIAMMIYKQGMECDETARLLRIKLPNFIELIRQEVKERMGSDYMKEKEKDILISW